ncbi:MAG: class I SAM-dependent methyltransferase [Anaeromyxobacter sp.]
MPEPLDPALERLRDLLVGEAARRAPPELRSLPRALASAAPVPAELLDLVRDHRAELLEWLDGTVPPRRPGGGWPLDPAGHLAGRLLRHLLARNQFLPLDAARVAALEALHARALAAAADALREAEVDAELAAGLAGVEAAYREDLRAFVAALLKVEVAGPVAGLRQVVSAEYTAALQLRVLGLDARELLEPVLDLGCGPEARLVRLLREAGKDARGVDRLAEPGEGVSRADWFEVEVAPGTLGTVLSHLAFSLHFVHHHLRPGDEALRYARRYMELLRALRPGGVFAYAPGLPFVEDHLDPATWRVERAPVPAPPPAGAGAVPWYAARVTRLR